MKSFLGQAAQHNTKQTPLFCQISVHVRNQVFFSCSIVCSVQRMDLLSFSHVCMRSSTMKHEQNNKSDILSSLVSLFCYVASQVPKLRIKIYYL